MIPDSIYTNSFLSPIIVSGANILVFNDLISSLLKAGVKRYRNKAH